MLMSLHIENIAVIEKAEIEFDSGLNVLTGETGAGKSIVIDAINAVLGERVSKELIRTGSDKAFVTALFSNISSAARDVIAECGFEPDEDGTLMIQRSIAADGKSGCRINGRPATVSLLRLIGRALVNIHGQHENQALLNVERHIQYLDRLGGLSAEKERYEQAYHHYCTIRKRLKALETDEGEKARRIDLLRYQIDEIEAAHLQVGEEQNLISRRDFCRNVEKVADALHQAKSLMNGDDDTIGALLAVTRMSDLLSEASRYMNDADSVSARMKNLRYELEECAEELRGLVASLDFDPAELEEVETRLDMIRRLTVKYGQNEEAILAYQQSAMQELDEIESADTLMIQLQKELETAESHTVEAAEALTEARKKAAEYFTSTVMEQLTFLDMPGVRLEVSIAPTTLTVSGGDKVEFLISANPGEPAKSIAKIASGGELSRIMLAIQSVLADADGIDTLIFDEVDTGISGRAAQKVGVKLRETAATRQILCVTHLAQIAARAHHHLLIAKQVAEGRTFTHVMPLDEEKREQELARIIGGDVTQINRQAAREMLEKVIV